MKLTDISKEDKDFLDAVYEKARYLKYLKAQDELVKENCRSIRKRNILMVSGLVPFLILIILAVNESFTDTAVMLVLCISILSLGSCYEYMEENVKNEAYNK